MVDLAVRGFYTGADLKLSGVVKLIETTFDFENNMKGIQFIVSKHFAVIDPYFTIGYVKGEGNLKLTGSSEVLNYTTAMNASYDPTSIQYILGAQASILALNLAAEYSRQFGTSRFTTKVSFTF